MCQGLYISSRCISWQYFYRTEEHRFAISRGCRTEKFQAWISEEKKRDVWVPLGSGSRKPSDLCLVSLLLLPHVVSPAFTKWLVLSASLSSCMLSGYLCLLVCVSEWLNDRLVCEWVCLSFIQPIAWFPLFDLFSVCGSSRVTDWRKVLKVL